MIMKRIFFIAMFLVSALAAIGQTDATPDKGAGLWYFSGLPGAVPNAAFGTELAWNINNKGLYYWDRDSLGWYAFTTASGTPSLTSVLTESNDAGALKITNLATPTAASDAATKGYVDSVVDTIYTSGDALIIANGLGVTFANDAAAGTYTITIPEGVIVRRVIVDADLGDDDGNGELFVAFNYTGTRTFNQGLTTAWTPYVRIWESGGSAPSRSTPKNLFTVPVQGISSVGSGDIEIVVTNFTSFTPNPVISFEFE
jgi:hypothetical protein